MKRVTITDVARHAGTSTAVVSYVINPGTRPVSEALRERVLKSLEELDYRPDGTARALRRRRRWGQIGLLVPDLELPLYRSIVTTLEQVGRSTQQMVITGTTAFDADVEAELVSGLLDAGIDGLIAVSAARPDLIAERCAGARLPIVWVHNNGQTPQGATVVSDHKHAGWLAARHLVEHGRKNIVFVGGVTEQDAPTGDRETVLLRYQGFSDALGEEGRIVRTDLTLPGAYRAMYRRLAAGQVMDGIVVGTYGQAAAVLRAITDIGLAVPQDVAVVAFDGDIRNRYDQIVLTAVAQDVNQIARRALHLVHGTWDKRMPADTPLEVTLAIGESCGCARESAL